MKAMERVARRSGLLVCAWALAACGGGGGGGSSSAPPPLSVDARNGSYTVVAADAREYTLALDFDAKTYHMTGTGLDQAGAFTEQSGTFFFQPGNASGASGSSTTRFQLAADAVIGELVLPSGALPFVASRRFVTRVADAVGTYNLLVRVVVTGGGPGNNNIQQGEITADGRLRICEDLAINPISSCVTVTSGPLTVANGVFTAATPGGPLVFRIAQVGADKVFLRASASTVTTRKFAIGVPATATFTGGVFAGGTSEPAWGTVDITETTFTSTGTSPSGVSSTRSGAVQAVSALIPGIRFISGTTAGSFFAVRSSEIGAMVAVHDSTLAPGFIAIGRKQ